MSRAMIVVGTLAVLGLSACGNSQGDRALSGAGIGAAGGAVLGLTVGAPLAGAAIGGAAGAAVGASTTRDDVNLGRPAWRDDR